MAIIDGDKEKTVEAVEEALQGGMASSDIIEKGLSPRMEEVGERFARYEIYLSEMMMAAEAWEQAMKVLEPKLVETDDERKKVGKVVIDTVSGDVHSIGKNIVAASVFVARAKEVGADSIGADGYGRTAGDAAALALEVISRRGGEGDR